ncbi:prefoldin subunit 2, variant [Blastomyces dermatitidis ER-3]|uniref:Prefoldin subunit 2, variant n=2 Tax=Ajellomyces dermatitidis TaxID=5039 RepID=A0A0J9ENM5_AJEDA|nr:prefoldin subunit 2, variant [Blastomyces dermatitidis ER-3]EQL37174.1 prefoldin subunit 2, variant [Blastomyces dermatitidis ATCC 26199]KMW66885.1 prefoldin subunit 2, variant [Blastomyces dermatitidis ATCC 18188]OAS99962.1 prefoldin subunit 2, variant [Blastomyces dermatitidis ER-3]
MFHAPKPPSPSPAQITYLLTYPYLSASPPRLVIDTLEPLAGDRKCFRLINGVLVERTVKDVIPPLKTNSDGLKQVLDELLKQYKAKQDELDGWKKKNNIQVVRE